MEAQPRRQPEQASKARRQICKLLLLLQKVARTVPMRAHAGSAADDSVSGGHARSCAGAAAQPRRSRVARADVADLRSRSGNTDGGARTVARWCGSSQHAQGPRLPPLSQTTRPRCRRLVIKEPGRQQRRSAHAQAPARTRWYASTADERSGKGPLHSHGGCSLLELRFAAAAEVERSEERGGVCLSEHTSTSSAHTARACRSDRVGCTMDDMQCLRGDGGSAALSSRGRMGAARCSCPPAPRRRDVTTYRALPLCSLAVLSPPLPPRRA